MLKMMKGIILFHIKLWYVLVELILQKVELIKKYFPLASITTDVIVGFPTETDEDFETTLNFVKDIKLSKIHVFKYSPRKGTRAATFTDDVHGTIKEERSKAVIAADRKNEEDFDFDSDAGSNEPFGTEIRLRELCRDYSGYA